MDIIKTLDFLIDLMAENHNLSRENAMEIVRFSIGTSFIVDAFDDKIERLIKAGFLEGKLMDSSEL